MLAPFFISAAQDGQGRESRMPHCAQSPCAPVLRYPHERQHRTTATHTSGLYISNTSEPTEIKLCGERLCTYAACASSPSLETSSIPSSPASASSTAASLQLGPRSAAFSLQISAEATSSFTSRAFSWPQASSATRTARWYRSVRSLASANSASFASNIRFKRWISTIFSRTIPPMSNADASESSGPGLALSLLLLSSCRSIRLLSSSAAFLSSFPSDMLTAAAVSAFSTGERRVACRSRRSRSSSPLLRRASRLAAS